MVADVVGSNPLGAMLIAGPQTRLPSGCVPQLQPSKRSSWVGWLGKLVVARQLRAERERDLRAGQGSWVDRLASGKDLL